MGVVERDVQREIRHELCDPVYVAVRHAEDAPDVADRRLRAECPERDDVSDPVASVALRHVADDLVAAIVGKIDVHVRHRDAFRVQESLEQQPVTHRIDVRDGQTVRGQRARGRAATGSHRDALLARVADEVPDDEEVARESHLLDDGQLLGEPRLDGVARTGPVPPPEPIMGQLVEIAVERVLVGDDVARQVELAEVEGQVASLGDRQRVTARLGEVGEDARHLLGGLDVELLRREAEAARIVEIRAGLDTEERFVGPGVAGLEVVRVVRADDRRSDGGGDPERLGHDSRLLVEPVGLDLHEVVVLAEDLTIPAGGFSGPQGLAGAQESRDLGVQAPGEDEQPLGMLREELPIHPGFVVEPLQVRLRHELDEILIPCAVSYEDRQVVGTLVAAVLRAAFATASGRHVELAPEDRLDAGLLGCEVEIDRAEEVAMVGERDRREPELLRLRDELLELGRTVEQAVLGVDVQVDEVAMLHELLSSH